ncbi:hypothetical protein GCM10022254_62520 [Actinomadura meridiana]|uniref:Enoyl-CoA hydratase n=1 Tax=Actinomadura meridiana TaxID=559626 RepID=A0ABP8CJ11_9ACTN
MGSNFDPDRLADGLGIVTTVTGARPLAEVTAAVNAVCAEAEDRRGHAVVVLRLAPGPDGSREWPGSVGIQDVNRWERAVRRLERLPVLTIAVAEGPCGGPALDLLLASDFRIGSPDLRLVLPINDGHFWPGMALFRLVQHLGVAWARKVVLWGVDLSGDRAVELGLIDEISTDLAEAIHTAAVLRGRISGPETTVRRQLVLEAASAEYEEALGAHLAACDRELRRLHGMRGVLEATEAGS